MTTTLSTTSAVVLIQDAIALREYSEDARKSGEARGVTRLIDQANDADREAMENIRQAQELLEQMAAAITAA